jgi:hypothetical protein
VNTPSLLEQGRVETPDLIGTMSPYNLTIYNRLADPIHPLADMLDAGVRARPVRARAWASGRKNGNNQYGGFVSDETLFLPRGVLLVRVSE